MIWRNWLYESYLKDIQFLLQKNAIDKKVNLFKLFSLPITHVGMIFSSSHTGQADCCLRGDLLTCN